MVAVDTNVLVRLLVDDDHGQHRTVRRLFASQSVHLPDTVLLETEWILRDFFDFTPAAVCAALRLVCGLPNVSLRDAALVAQVIDWHEAGLDFADAMHLATAGEMPFRTFDKELVKSGRRIADRAVAEP